MRLNNFLKIFILSTFSLQLFAESSSKNITVTSLEWQKKDLEQRLFRQVDRKLSALLNIDEYTIDIQIDLNKVKKPNFDIENTGADKEKLKVRFTNQPSSAAPADYLIFSKIGLEAPLVDDYVEDKYKPKRRKTEFDNIWKLNQNLDIFKNIDSIIITILLSKEIPKDKRPIIQNILKSANFDQGEITPELDIKYIDMFYPKPVPAIESFRDFLEWGAKYSVLFGAILSSLILAAIAFVIFERYKKLVEEQGGDNTQITMSQEENTKDEEEEDPDGQSPFGAGDLNGAESTIYSGIDRFKMYLKASPEEATLVVKKWIKAEEDPMAEKALNAIVQQLSSEDLSQIFSNLSVQERNEWKAKLKRKFSIDELKDINTYISTTIVDEIIVPRTISDNELYNLIINLTPDMAAKFITDNAHLGKILTNVTTTKFTSRILEHLDLEFANYVLNDSLFFNQDAIQELIPELKQKLSEYQNFLEINPFLDKITELIPMASIEKELLLFQALAKSGDEDNLRVLGMKYFPSSIIERLPAELLSDILENYPANERADLLASLDSHMQKLLINAFAKEGSTLRDMLDMELEKYNMDIGLQRKLRKEKNIIWEKFIAYARNKIRKDNRYTDDVETVINEWIRELNINLSSSAAA